MSTAMVRAAAAAQWVQRRTVLTSLKEGRSVRVRAGDVGGGKLRAADREKS